MMKRGITILSAAALTLALAGPVMAQNRVTNPGAENADYAFFDSHPNVARALRENPSLIDNQQWVDQHPDLHEYLKTHPNVRHEFKSHPYKFMHRAEEMQNQPHPGAYAHGPNYQGHPGEYTHGEGPYEKHHHD
jgi:hypothetical protein